MGLLPYLQISNYENTTNTSWPKHNLLSSHHNLQLHIINAAMIIYDTDSTSFGNSQEDKTNYMFASPINHQEQPFVSKPSVRKCARTLLSIQRLLEILPIWRNEDRK